ncbi:DegT/DnrJ/EryC1/StrS family aminotransferase [Azotosporobacter soli]|uniref:DegT/DnrJ/EryC1/StrS family aminotransferase n=1 Tax=Azotosporobacter soli TaxID=3055040 RepID=UPI0031FF4686
MKTILQNFFQSERFLLIDRAFLGLYAVFCEIKKKTGKNKIIFTAMTCPSPVFAAIMAGCEPVFIDINEKDYLMDFSETVLCLETQKDIAAVVYIYIFGNASEDVLKLRQLTQESGIYLIEDAAQAFGGEIAGRKIGRVGDAAVFSFGHSKQIDAGAGGCLVLNSMEFNLEMLEWRIGQLERFAPDEELAKNYRDEFYAVRKQGLLNPLAYQKYEKFQEKYRGLYLKQITVDWASVREKTEKFILNNEIDRRYERALAYQTAFKNMKCCGKLSLPIISKGTSVYRYTFMAKNAVDAEAISELLRKNDIHCSNLHIPVSRIYHQNNYEHAVDFAKRVINLWVDDVATDQYIQKTVQIIAEYYEKAGAA